MGEVPQAVEYPPRAVPPADRTEARSACGTAPENRCLSPLEAEVSRGPHDRPPPQDLGNREQVRRLRRAMDRSATTVVRCQNCGHQQLAEAAFIGPRSTCDRCGTALHSCRHCRKFDPRARHQCLADDITPVGDKWAPNDCRRYEPRLVLDATGKRHGGKGKQDAKALFDSLFKKP